MSSADRSDGEDLIYTLRRAELVYCYPEKSPLGNSLLTSLVNPTTKK